MKLECHGVVKKKKKEKAIFWYGESLLPKVFQELFWKLKFSSLRVKSPDCLKNRSQQKSDMPTRPNCTSKYNLTADNKILAGINMGY